VIEMIRMSLGNFMYRIGILKEKDKNRDISSNPKRGVSVIRNNNKN
jgi:hypothetical protein